MKKHNKEIMVLEEKLSNTAGNKESKKVEEGLKNELQEALQKIEN